MRLAWMATRFPPTPVACRERERDGTGGTRRVKTSSRRATPPEKTDLDPSRTRFDHPLGEQRRNFAVDVMQFTETKHEQKALRQTVCECVGLAVWKQLSDRQESILINTENTVKSFRWTRVPYST